jgi:hypothetical protein
MLDMINAVTEAKGPQTINHRHSRLPSSVIVLNDSANAPTVVYAKRKSIIASRARSHTVNRYITPAHGNRQTVSDRVYRDIARPISFLISPLLF